MYTKTHGRGKDLVHRELLENGAVEGHWIFHGAQPVRDVVQPPCSQGLVRSGRDKKQEKCWVSS